MEEFIMLDPSKSQKKSAHAKIIRLIQSQLSGKIITPFEIRLWDDSCYSFGEPPAEVSFIAKDRLGLLALCSLDELKFCEAYLYGNIDINGDMLKVADFRKILSDRHLLQSVLSRILPLLIGLVPANRKAIASHYEFDNDFYLTFMDKTRCYSQAVFEKEDEPLELAQNRKLEYAINACRLKPGDRVLDVGGGWGTFTEYAGKLGIQVTSLTISKQSEKFLTDLIQRLKLPCQALYKDFFEYESPEPYDGIVILGVMEHLSDYCAVIDKFKSLLKPGGRVYMDASAYWKKYSKPAFIARHVFPGNHSYFYLKKFLDAVKQKDFELVAVHNDRHSYFLTCKAWAENLDAARNEIVQRWGEQLYRRFRLYLWGSAHAFFNHGLEAYRVVIERLNPREC